MSSEVECSDFFDICTRICYHIERLEPSNSRYWLQAQCRHFDSDKEEGDVTIVTDELYKLKANSCISILKS